MNGRAIAQPLCVLCRQRPAGESWYPFCSERCKLQDLARWLDRVYRVPGEGAPPEDPGSNPDSNSKDS